MPLKDVIRKWWRGEGQEEIRTPAHERATFILEFEHLVLGSLRLRDGIWEFEYSPQFLAQGDKPDAVRPLVDFPDPTKVYVSRDLWPFFMARIPSLSQPQVAEEVQRQGIDPNSAPQLLEHFGKRSIANPFELTPV
jgi:hypothetical protein